MDDLFRPIDVDGIEGRGFEYGYEYIEGVVDDIIGYKTDYAMDNPNLEKKATDIIEGINALCNDVNAHPEKYFPRKRR